MTRHFLSRSPFSVLALAGLLTACGSPKLEPAPRRALSIAVVADASTSADVKPGQTIADLRCSQVTAIVGAALTTPGLSRLELLLMATGGRGTSNEGRVIIPWRSFVPQAHLFAKNKSPDQQRQSFLQGIEGSCRATLKSENTSPIFFAVERAAESLRQHTAAQPRNGETAKRLFLLSDLRENVHHGLKSRLLAVSNAHRKGVSVPAATGSVPTLKLDGVALLACGRSGHAGGSADDLAISPRAVTEVWQSVFQGAASFDAACPEPSEHFGGGAR